jgi:hypothetical protein
MHNRQDLQDNNILVPEQFGLRKEIPVGTSHSDRSQVDWLPGNRAEWSRNWGLVTRLPSRANATVESTSIWSALSLHKKATRPEDKRPPVWRRVRIPSTVTLRVASGDEKGTQSQMRQQYMVMATLTSEWCALQNTDPPSRQRGRPTWRSKYMARLKNM